VILTYNHQIVKQYWCFKVLTSVVYVWYTTYVPIEVQETFSQGEETMSKKTAVQREITILARYTIKRDHVNVDGTTYKAGSIVLWVENDRGDRYYVTLRRHAVHSCSCPHIPTKKSPSCYHIEQSKTVENARAAKAVAAKLAREVEEICVEAEKELAASSTPARDLAPLNGSRPFSLLRVA
jgi:hypothetical protein